MSRIKLDEDEVVELTLQLVTSYKENINKRVRSIVTVLEKIIFSGVILPGVRDPEHYDINGDVELRIEYLGQNYVFVVHESSYGDRFWFSGEVYLVDGKEELRTNFVDTEEKENMTTKTFDEILEEVNEVSTSEYSIDKYELVLEDLDVEGFEQITQEGGYEGGAEYCYTVFRWKDKIYRVEYSYYSHHGFDLDDVEHTLREVKPQQKTVTVYE